jgi:hypothetical protein
MNPMPLKVSSGGYKGSKNCMHFWGHYGRPAGALWPFADVGAIFQPSDLSQFKAVRFAVKGNGKKYMIMLQRPPVRDYGNFRAQFTAPKEWTEVEIKFDDFQQPDWAHPIQKGWVDVTGIRFLPDAQFSDEDYDISIDNLELVK